MTALIPSWAWCAVAVAGWCTGDALRRRRLITSRQRAGSALVFDALWWFSMLLIPGPLPAVLLVLGVTLVAVDVHRWWKARDDDDDQDRKRRLRSRVRSHIPRPTVRSPRPARIPT